MVQKHTFVALCLLCKWDSAELPLITRLVLVCPLCTILLVTAYVLLVSCMLGST